MKKSVFTHSRLAGFHFYPNAPEKCKYLASIHRHIFDVYCFVNVEHNNRDVEFIGFQDEYERELHRQFGEPLELGAMSCEDLACWLLEKYPEIHKVIVQEDGNGGTEIAR